MLSVESLDFEFIAGDEEEILELNAGSGESNEEENDDILEADEPEQEMEDEKQNLIKNKRKRQEGTVESEQPDMNAIKEKKKKSNKSKKTYLTPDVIPTFPREQIKVLYECFMTYHQREMKMSRLELDELQEKYVLRPEYTVDTSLFEGERKLESMEEFFKVVLGDFVQTKIMKSAKEASKKTKSKLQENPNPLVPEVSVPNGKPFMVIVCASGIRCADVIRSLPTFHQQCKIGKMFSKHFKLSEQKAYLQSNQVNLVVGTPARLFQLSQESNLFEKVEHIVLDMGKNKKEQTILDMKDGQKELLVHLMPVIFDLLMKEQTKLLFY